MAGTLSLLGLYTHDDTLFDNLVLPNGIDRENLIDNLLAETAELEILYPNYSFMKAMIGVWSKKELPIWEKQYATTQLDYNPIENYDRQESWTTSENGNRMNTTEGESTFTGSTEGTDSGSMSGEENHSKSAYNSSTFTPTEKTARTQEETHTAEQTSDSTTSTSGKTNEQNTVNSTHTSRTHGNIGVTTSQQMIEEERRVVEFNIIDYIVDSFKRRFCLLIY